MKIAHREVISARLERATDGLEGRCSIQLSYETIVKMTLQK